MQAPETNRTVSYFACTEQQFEVHEYVIVFLVFFALILAIICIAILSYNMSEVYRPNILDTTTYNDEHSNIELVVISPQAMQ